MRKFTYIFIVCQVILISCNQTDTDLTEWNKIKDEKDFSAFFSFALTVDDSLLFYQCIDSLELYKPKNNSFVLRYYDYYIESEDSIYHFDYYLSENIKYSDIKDRNIVFINIDSSYKVEIEYSDLRYLDYYNLLFTLFDTSGSSYDLPEYFMTSFQGKEYIARKLGTFISSDISNDTLNEKEAWIELIKTNKQVLEAYEKVREYKSQEIFKRSFKNLNETERKFIINLVPIFIENYFNFSFITIPPPPPPIVDIVNDK